jgi:hypothetical protein
VKSYSSVNSAMQDSLARRRLRRERRRRDGVELLAGAFSASLVELLTRASSSHEGSSAFGCCAATAALLPGFGLIVIGADMSAKERELYGDGRI